MWVIYYYTIFEKGGGDRDRMVVTSIYVTTISYRELSHFATPPHTHTVVAVQEPITL